MKLGKVLKDTKFGKPQNVGNMIVVPIVSDTECLEVSEDMLFHIASDTDYAHLTLKNADNRPVVIPQGTSYLTKQKAQDRTILSAHVIEAAKEETVNVSCVESSQGGNLETGTEDFTFIPASIRIPAITKEQPGHSEYNVLWKDIEEYMKKIGIGPGRAHINDFYTHFKKELDEFIASFEPVDKQIGAVILINNVVVGVEIFPNYGSWKKIWRKLIRDSYGADAMALIKKETVIGMKPFVNLDKVNSMEELEEQSKKVIVKNLEFVQKTLEPLIDTDLTQKTLNEVDDDFVIKNIKIGELTGQLVTKSDTIIYVTAMKSLL